MALGEGYEVVLSVYEGEMFRTEEERLWTLTWQSRDIKTSKWIFSSVIDFWILIFSQILLNSHAIIWSQWGKKCDLKFFAAGSHMQGKIALKQVRRIYETDV